MNGNDRCKLQRAGFRIFRERHINPSEPDSEDFIHSIWEFTPQGSWMKFSEYKTRKGFDWAWKEIMKDEKCIGE